MFPNAASRKRANAQPVDDMTGSLLPPKKTLRTATLGRRDWDTGNAFTITYDVIHDLPCVVLVSTHPTVKPGRKVLLTEDSDSQMFADRVVIPLRIFLDLVHMALTHDEDEYQKKDLYFQTEPSKDKPMEVIKGIPDTWDDVGCYHRVTVIDMDDHLDIDPTIDTTDEEDTSDQEDTAPLDTGVVTDVGKSPKIPQVSKSHLTCPGKPEISCTIVRQPNGPIFIATSCWDVEIGDGEKISMMPENHDEAEYVFPLCHTEQLPGLVAVVHKWLEADYQKMGLLVTCNVLSKIELIPTPIEALGYRYTLGYIYIEWPIPIDPTEMWQTWYEDTVVSVEPQYGCRDAMIKCPHSKRHCPVKKGPKA